MSIAVITPSVRPNLLEMVARCLKRQTLRDFIWYIGSPASMLSDVDDRLGREYDYEFIAEPKKREGDYYSLNKSWNSMFRIAKGELVVNIVDGLWFEPTLLESLWSHYKADSKACIGAVGDQYDQMKNGKPEHMIWRDPRKRGGMYQVSPNEFEMCVASIPTQAIRDVGGIDEEYDKYAALSEKEMCYRIAKLGYRFFLDESLEYRAIKHPRLNEKWDERYNAGCEVYARHLQEINSGSRLKLDYLD